MVELEDVKDYRSMKSASYLYLISAYSYTLLLYA